MMRAAMPRATKRVTAALLLSAGLHAGVAALVAPAADGAAVSGAAAYVARLTVRLALAAPAVAPRAAPAAEQRPPSLPSGTTEAPHQRTEAVQESGGHGSALVGVQGSHYFKASELQQRPQPVGVIAFDGRGEDATRGYLLLKLLINEAGTVDDVVVVVDDAQPDLLENARHAFSAARYTPGTRGGYPVKSELLVEVKLDPIVIPDLPAQQ